VVHKPFIRVTGISRTPLHGECRRAPTAFHHYVRALSLWLAGVCAERATCNSGPSIRYSDGEGRGDLHATATNGFPPATICSYNCEGIAMVKTEHNPSSLARCPLVCCLTLVLVAPGWAAAQSRFSGIVVFGTSLSDCQRSPETA
jgi:hypothetical protein